MPNELPPTWDDTQELSADAVPQWEDTSEYVETPVAPRPQRVRSAINQTVSAVMRPIDILTNPAVGESAALGRDVAERWRQAQTRVVAPGAFFPSLAGPEAQPSPEDRAAGLQLVRSITSLPGTFGSAVARTVRDVLNPSTYLPEDMKAPPPFVIGGGELRQMTRAEEAARDPLQGSRALIPLRGTELQPEGSEGAQLLSGLSTPDNIGIIATGGASKIAGMALLFTMAPDVYEDVKRIASSEVPFDQKRQAINNLVLPIILGLKGAADRPVIEKPQLVGPPAMGSMLRTPGGFTYAGRSAELVGPQPTAKVFRPEVPGTPAEPRLSMTEEIRAKNARTKAEIKSIFPGLSNEQARALAIRVWGTAGDFGVVVSPTVPIPERIADRPEIVRPPGAPPPTPFELEQAQRRTAEAEESARQRGYLDQMIITQERELAKALAAGDIGAERAATKRLQELRQQRDAPPAPAKGPIRPKAPPPAVSRQAVQPTVPETPAEAERNLNVIQEIRAAGARTRNQIKALFPDRGLKNEEAARLRDQAWGKQPEAPAAAPSWEETTEVPPEEGARAPFGPMSLADWKKLTRHEAAIYERIWKPKSGEPPTPPAAPPGPTVPVTPPAPPAAPAAAPATVPQPPRTQLPATMETVRKVADMGGMDFFNNLQQFNSINFQIGKAINATEAAEVRKLLERVTAEAEKARSEGMATKDFGKVNEAGALMQKAQFFSEILRHFDAKAAEAAATLAPKSGTVRLYHGEGATAGAGTGGSWFTENPEYAAQFGAVTYVDVPADVANAARGAARATGTGGPHFVLPDEYAKQAKPMETQPGAKVHEITESEVPKVTPESIRAEFDKYDDTGEHATIRDLVDKIDQMAEAHPDADGAGLLRQAVDRYRQALEEDFSEHAGRGDMDAAEDKFLRQIEQAAKFAEREAKRKAPPATIEATKIAGKTLADWEQATEVSQLPKGIPRAELARFLAVPNQPSRILAALKNKKRTREIHAPPPAAPAPKPAAAPEAPEKITAAAYQPRPGITETGANHPEILKRLGVTGFESPESRNTPQFGFQTDKRGFITREEAGPIAEKSGQNLKEFEPGEPVHSNEVASPTEPGTPLSEGKKETGAAFTLSYEYHDEPTGKWIPVSFKAIVTRNAKPGEKPWRLTAFNNLGEPFGHVDAFTKEEAMSPHKAEELSGLQNRYTLNVKLSQAEKPLSETGPQKPKFKMTFEQFLTAPREGELLDELRKVPKAELSPERKAAKEKYDKAYEALEAAKLGWVTSRDAQAELAVRQLSKKKRAIVDRYNATLDEYARVTHQESGARQRVLYDELVKRGVIDPGTTPEQLAGPGSPAAGQGPDPDPLITGLSAGSPAYNSLRRKVQNFYSGIRQLFTRRADKQTLMQLTNAADNIPRLEGQRAGNSIRLRTDAMEQNALTFVTQALKMSGEGLSPEATERLGELEFLGDPQGYLETRATDMETKAQEFLHNGQKLEAQAALDAAKYMRYAKRNFGRLRQLADLGRRKLDAQYQREQAAGVSGDYENWHVPQRHDLDLMTSSDRPIILGHSKGSGTATGFRKAKVFEDYATAIENGFVPRSLNFADLLEHRVNQGERLIQRKALFDGMKGMTDPVDGQPLAKNIPRRQIRRPDGTIDTQESVPRGYQPFEVLPGYRLAVHEGYARLMNALTGTSQISESAVVGALQDIAGLNKHVALALDTFHASRTMQAELALTGKLSVGERQRIGRALVEYDPRDLAAAVRKGEITQEMADFITTPIPMEVGGREISVSPANLIKLGARNGLNMARFNDALYHSWVREMPITGAVNKWVFDKMTRSAISQGFIAEFQRVAKDNPTLNATQVARKVASDVNLLFGNLQKESIFRNPSVKAINQILFLAPNWVESLARRELRALRQFGEAGGDIVRGRPSGRAGGATAEGGGPELTRIPRIGSVGKTIGTGLAAYFVATQVLNLITRRQLTFQNPEPGHKLDAWIPDASGKTKGFFISPLSVFGEITHDLIRYSREKADTASAVTQILANKLGNMARVLEVIAMGRDPASGEKIIGTSRRALAAGLQMVPIPISVSQAARGVGAAVAPGLITPPAPGSIQRQIVSSMGFKTEPAGTAQRQIYALADKWKSQSSSAKIRAEVERRLKEDFGPSDYKDIRLALLRNDLSGARRAFDDLRKTKEPQVINRALKHPHPFTGSAQAERAFVRSLSDQDKKLYREALEERKLLYSRYRQMLSQ